MPSTPHTNPSKTDNSRQTLLPGDVFSTVSGRQTTPFPEHSKSASKAQFARDDVVIRKWTKQNAILEAQARGDESALLQFEALNPLKWTPSDADQICLYLFDDTSGRIGHRRVQTDSGTQA